MSSRHSLIEQLADDRRQETYRLTAKRRSARDRGHAESHRARAGWFLVALGLRLATTGDRRAARVTTLAGR